MEKTAFAIFLMFFLMLIDCLIVKAYGYWFISPISIEVGTIIDNMSYPHIAGFLLFKTWLFGNIDIGVSNEDSSIKVLSFIFGRYLIVILFGAILSYFVWGDFHEFVSWR